jgi:phospholipase A2
MAKYLGLEEKDVHPDDVPVVAMCGSGGGLRALVAGTGSLLATSEDGLFDCVTYLSGVSGSCWLQALYYSSITERNFHRAIDHLKARLGVHIAYPPAAFSSVISAPTNKYLLSGMVEKLKGDPNAVFGLVDVYGLLLAARLLVPKGELGVNEKDFKLSSQREYIRYGQHPLPIYTAVRHEIPDTDASASDGGATAASVGEKRKATQEPWFQWFEVTPYEFFCEEFTAGIPTWAMGRKFKDGTDVPTEDGLHLPEIRMPFLFGTFGSAFCATLSHYYREIRPMVLSLSGFAAVDEMIYGRKEDLSKVHPINPATLPNFAYGMKEVLPKTAPKSIYENEYIELMDAGMSNNLPIYPLLRPGREVEVVIAFDASADIKADNWLSVADGYARQRGIKGWPVGIGWPNVSDPAKKTAKELDEAQASSVSEADDKLEEAKVDQAARRVEAGQNGKEKDAKDKYEEGDETAGELGYCTVWVGSTQERTSEPPLPAKAIDDTTSWRLMEADAGLTVVYCPFLTNDKVPGVDPATSDYMSTWNFVYTPDQVDKVVALARANYDESKAQIRATIRAVYERKKRIRLDSEAQMKKERYRRLVRLGVVGKLGEGDHFS